jgi:hypothetical protein
MSSAGNPDESTETPDGSTNVTSRQQDQTDSLADGSQSGDATTDPEQSNDITSGGSPDDN